MSHEAPSAREPSATDELIGREVAGYELKRVLGSGGMGTVYWAEHRLIKSRVAVKILKPKFCSNPTIVQRFLMEARAVNLIGHENIVKIFDFGMTQDGLHYFVMEFLEGATLAQYISGPTSLPAVAPIVYQIMDALSAAHDAGVVHRDLKPENILVMRASSGPIVKVLDFGVAKLLAPDAGVRTEAGIVLGTPHYMAPEQVLGQPCDARSDVYALGVLLFWIATGRRLFESNILSKLLMDHAYQAAPRPSEVHSDLHPSFDAVLLRSLAKDPAERYQTIRDFRAGFELAVVLAKEAEEAKAAAARAPQSGSAGAGAKSVKGLVAPDAPEPRRPPRKTISETFDRVAFLPGAKGEGSKRVELEVQLGIGDMESFRKMYAMDISRHGMFIATEEQLPALQSIIDVTIFSPAANGDVTLSGRVILHVTTVEASAFGGKPGMALQLLDLDSDKRAKLERMLQTLAPQAPPGPPEKNAKAARLIERYGGEGSKSPYQQLQIVPSASAPEIRESVRMIRREMDPDMLGPVTDEQARSLARIREQIDKAAELLLDAKSRATLDASTGNFLGVAQALAAGLSIEDLAALRAHHLSTRWDSPAIARAHVREAMTAEYAGNLNEARLKLERALAVDPLDVEIHNRYWALRHRTGSSR